MREIIKTFNIPVENFSAFTSKFEKIIQKAKKLNVEIPSFNVVEYGKVIGIDKPIEYNVIEVFGSAPKFDGYSFVGTIEHTGQGNLLLAMSGKEIPIEFVKAESTCDHCKKVRNRSETFLVEKEGKLTRVGRSCLKDFLGHKSPEYIALYESVLHLADSDENGEYFNNGPSTYHLESFLSYVVASVTAKGWSPKGVTASNAFKHMTASNDEMKAYKETRYAITEEIVLKAKQCIEFAKNVEPNNSFLQNIKVIANMDYIKSSHLNLAAAIYRAQMNDAEFKAKCAEEKRLREEANALRLKENEGKTYVGEVGKRLELSLTIYDKLDMGVSNFGYVKQTSTLLKMKDDNGNELACFTTNGRLYNVGDKKIFKATVKKHSEYKGVKQTLLTRIKIHVDKKVAKARKEAISTMQNKIDEIYSLKNSSGFKPNLDINLFFQGLDMFTSACEVNNSEECDKVLNRFNELVAMFKAEYEQYVLNNTKVVND